MNNMNTSLAKRLLSFMLITAIILGLVPAMTVMQAQAKTADALDASKPEIVALRNYAETLDWPVAVRMTNPGDSSAMTGHWMITVERLNNGNTTNEMYTADTELWVNIEGNKADPNVYVKVLHANSGGAVNELHNMPQQFIMSLSGTGSSFTIQNYKKQYWYIHNIDHGNTDTTNYDITFTTDVGSANTNSIKSFLMGKHTDPVSPATLKTLAVDMLNYGAAAAYLAK